MNSCPWHGSLSKGTKAKCFYQFRYRRTDCTDNCLPSLISFLHVCGRESMPVWPTLQWYIVITTHRQLWLLWHSGKSSTIMKNCQCFFCQIKKLLRQLFSFSTFFWNMVYSSASEFISLCAMWRCSAVSPGAFSLSSSWWITRVRVGNSYSRLSQILVPDWPIKQWDSLS